MKKTFRFSTSQELLLYELKLLQEKNPRFSMRAFARMLSLSPSHLNQILTGKKHLSISAAKRISGKLKFEADYEKYFLLLVTLATAPEESQPLVQRKIDALFSKSRLKKFSPDGKLSKVRWEHLLFLVSLDLKETLDDADLHSFAKFAGIKRTDLQSFLKELITAGLVTKNEGSYERTHRLLTLEATQDNLSLKEIHSQYLKRLTQLIQLRPATKRYSATEFYSIPLEKLPLLRQRAEEFLDEVSGLSESGKQTGVVELSLHFNAFGASEVFDSSFVI